MATENTTRKAVWKESPKAKKYPQLEDYLQVDVAIVGGGITGITAAYLLSKAGKKVAVFEALEVARGTTGYSTGNLYSTVDQQLQSIESKHDEEALKEVVASRSAAIDLIEEQVLHHGIDCDFKRVPFYLFTTPETNSRNNTIEKEINASRSAGLAASDVPLGRFPMAYDKMVAVPNQAQFNPLKYVQELAVAASENPNCRIYENTQVTDIQEERDFCEVTTNAGKVKANKVIVATHSPKGIYAVQTMMEPYREYALAARLVDELPEAGMYWHLQEDQHYSLRPFSDETGNYLLALGEAHKVGQKTDNDENIRKIEEYLRSKFQVKEIAYFWGAQNYKSADHLPYIGTSPMENHKYIATGFAADGLVYGTLSAMILTDLIQGKENRWAEMYSPTRFTPAASAGKFAKENIDVATHLMKDYLFYGEADDVKEIRAGEGKTVKVDGERLAVYRDEGGELHMVSGICTHMGCVVHWNKSEKSWDCPCHGSRFSINGNVLEGPAYAGLAKPKVKREDNPN